MSQTRSSQCRHAPFHLPLRNCHSHSEYRLFKVTSPHLRPKWRGSTHISHCTTGCEQSYHRHCVCWQSGKILDWTTENTTVATTAYMRSILSTTASDGTDKKAIPLSSLYIQSLKPHSHSSGRPLSAPSSTLAKWQKILKGLT
jgi:hypothetical protein